MNQIVKWAEMVADATREISQADLSKAVAEFWMETPEQIEHFYKVAAAIVEPQGYLDTGYSEWMDEDIGNWAQWIKTTLGEDWGKIAHIVAVEGY